MRLTIILFILKESSIIKTQTIWSDWTLLIHTILGFFPPLRSHWAKCGGTEKKRKRLNDNHCVYYVSGESCWQGLDNQLFLSHPPANQPWRLSFRGTEATWKCVFRVALTLQLTTMGKRGIINKQQNQTQERKGRQACERPRLQKGKRNKIVEKTDNKSVWEGVKEHFVFWWRQFSRCGCQTRRCRTQSCPRLRSTHLGYPCRKLCRFVPCPGQSWNALWSLRQLQNCTF